VFLQGLSVPLVSQADLRGLRERAGAPERGWPPQRLQQPLDFLTVLVRLLAAKV
jgi:hypothetical protein